MAAVEFELSDRLGATEGTVAMTGVHALMRVTADQHRADGAAEPLRQVDPGGVAQLGEILRRAAAGDCGFPRVTHGPAAFPRR